MAATKTRIFSKEEKEIGILGRALAHPARIRILVLLDQYGMLRNCDLVNYLQLTKKAVHDHLVKLKDAALIKMEFKANSYHITRNDGAEQKMINFLANQE